MSGPSRVLVALRVPADAPRAFEAFTTEIARWWQPDGLFRFTDRRDGTLHFEPGVDGRLVEAYPDGSTFTVGEVLAWEPPLRLAITWRQASFGPDQSTELHVSFAPAGGETRVDHAAHGHVAEHHQHRGDDQRREDGALVALSGGAVGPWRCLHKKGG